MATRDVEQTHAEPHVARDHASSTADLREKELKEAEEIRERGTLTPEGNKQGVTSHLPAEETAYMYRSEDDREHPDPAGEDRPKNT